MLLLISSLLMLAVAVSSLHLQFVPPEAILQAGYPAGFRAFIPDFPGCEKFVFGGRLQSPLDDNEVNTFTAEVLRPVRGFWNFEDLGLVLTPGDIMHYWTLVVKDKMPFPRHNLSWTVPEPDEAVDMLKPITLKPPTTIKPPKVKPSKMVNAVPTTVKAESTSSPTKAPSTTENNEETSSTIAEEDKITLSLDGKIHPSLLEDENSTPADESETPTSNDDVLSRSGIQDTASTDSEPESTNSDAPSSPPITTSSLAKTTPEITTSQKPSEVPPSKSTTETTTSEKPSDDPTNKSTPGVTTSVKPPEEKPKASKPVKKSTKPEVSNPLMEDIEELTTPTLPVLPDKPLAGEFPQEPPPLFPFPGLFPRPPPRPVPKPLLPTAGPSFEICSNPWNFEEQVGETRTQRLERQLARLQCELALHQRSQAQLTNTVERELTDLKKLVFGMVSRMSRLESVLRSAAFG